MPLKIIVTGGTGFLGTALVTTLAEHGHQVVVFSRGVAGSRPITHHRRGFGGPAQASIAQPPMIVSWAPDGRADAWAMHIDDADAIVNLAGAGIADQRWTPTRKSEILGSRLDSTRSLVEALRGAATRPRVFVSGSAIGYYGTSEDATFDESSGTGRDFLAGVCVQWEAAAREAAGPHCRVVLLRTGIVLGPGGGALAKMAMPFRLFAGGPVGSGRQWMSWIHRDDWVALVERAISDTRIEGPLNAVAPGPVVNRAFCSALGSALHRPCWLPTPAFALRAILGELADSLLLQGQKVIPARALAVGFGFKYNEVGSAIVAAIRPGVGSGSGVLGF